MMSQNTQKHGVESTHPKFGGYFRTGKFFDSLLHLSCGLVGKGEGKDSIWFVTGRQEIHNLICQHSCLSRPCTGNHEGRSILVGHGFTLLRIEKIEIVIF